jgi:hypothetical protein
MRARRREREHVNGGRSQAPRRGDAGGGAGGGGGGGKAGKAAPKGNRKRRNRKRRPRTEGPRNHDVGFWGDPEQLPEPTQDVRITDDAAAVARSLGAPPLPGHERIASHYFTVVYERAVTTAGALAAAGGLIDPEALTEELSD